MGEAGINVGGQRVAAPPVHVLLIPFLGRSRALSMVGTALLLAKRSGFRCTIVSTPGNSSYIRGTVEQADNSEALPIDLEFVPFPAAEVGLPAGVECTDSLPTATGDKKNNFVKLYRGMQLLQHPIEKLVVDRRPDIILFDLVLYWFADIARSRSIPFFLLDTLSPFARALFSVLSDGSGDLNQAVCSPGSDTVGPLTALPHPLEFTRSELPVTSGSAYPGLFEKLRENDMRSCGVLLNSFEELTPEYLEYCRNMTDADLYSGCAFKFWCIGPVQLAANQDPGSGWDGMEIKKWLDSKQPESVLYVSFGSECLFGPEQLREIAVGLQSCGHPFVWVVRGNGGGAETMDEWLPQGFHDTVGDRGLILTEWAPQFGILNHRATGAFLTHCGWRSTLEAVCAGLPAIPWPLHSEQFINERLLVEILRMGVRILTDPKMRTLDVEGKGLVKGEVIRDAVDRLLGGADGEAIAMRETAKKYKELAMAAMAEGGSSYVNLSNVVEQMKMLAKEKRGLAAE